MSDAYTMPAGRTWCGLFRCCREAGHLGACEEDITMLDQAELQAIRNSAPPERVERTGGLLVHHPGPPPQGTGKPLIVHKVDAPGRYVSNEEAELLGPPVLDAAWWAAWREYASTTTTPQREEPQP